MKVKVYAISGTYAYPSQVTDSNGKSVDLTPENLKEGVSRFSSILPLRASHDDPEDVGGIIHTLNYDEATGKVHYDGFVFKEAYSAQITTKKMGISPEIYIDDDGLYFQAGVLTSNPALKETSIDGSYLYLEDDGMTDEPKTPEDKKESIVETQSDIMNEFSRKYLENKMKSDEKEIKGLTAKYEALEAEHKATLEKFEKLNADYTSMIELEISKVENNIKSFGIAKPDEIGKGLDAITRLGVLNSLSENLASKTKPNKPMDDELTAPPEGKSNEDRLKAIKERARSMGATEEEIEKLR